MQGDARGPGQHDNAQRRPFQGQGGQHQQSRPTNQPARPAQQQGQAQGQGQGQQQPRKPTAAHKPSSDATHNILNQVLASGEASGKQASQANGKQQQQAHPQQQAGRQQQQQQQQQGQRQHGKHRDKQVAGKKRKHADVAVPDDDGIAGADSDEEGHVGEALALVLSREKQLQQEVAGRAQRPGADDSDDDYDFIAQVGVICDDGLVAGWLVGPHADSGCAPAGACRLALAGTMLASGIEQTWHVCMHLTLEPPTTFACRFLHQCTEEPHAAFSAAAHAHCQQLPAHLTPAHPPAHPTQARTAAMDLPNVVHMDDDDGGAPYMPLPGSPRKRKKKQRQGSEAGKAKPAVQHKSGELAHAATNMSDTARKEYFGGGSGGAAAAGSFAALGVAPALAEHLESLEFKVPTRVQQLALPVLLRGRDALVRAPTGSGKTLSYLVPIVNDLQVGGGGRARGGRTCL